MTNHTRAVEFLTDLLSTAPDRTLPAREVISAAEMQGIDRYALQTARDRLALDVHKATGQQHGPWLWTYHPPRTDDPATTDLVTDPVTGLTASTVDQDRRTAPECASPYAVAAAAKVAPRTTVPYVKAPCPGPCGRYVLHRQEVNGRALDVASGEFVAYECPDCVAKLNAPMIARLRTRNADLEHEIQRLGAADPNDPGIYTAQRAITLNEARIKRLESGQEVYRA